MSKIYKIALIVTVGWAGFLWVGESGDMNIDGWMIAFTPLFLVVSYGFIKRGYKK